ncbi:sulfite exporter TauE/SafE family protein [Pelagibius sp. Alg239-R121]|uniref:sulfite exporter TauE/SafE family protein n=1 Tax=Pelagibius sp. Alg239-R121 TaxID=2993448 RepID=UPI0024A61D97|nr:sulfite exporter TauE/SafE family protein [Pelagibius sp. Alg239-R121]
MALENLEYQPLIYAGGVLFLAYMVRGIAGFGSGLIAVPLLAQVFPVQEIVPLVVFLDYVGSASQGLRNRNSIAWREQLPLIPFSLLGVGAGVVLFALAKEAVLAQALGGFVIFYAIYQLLPLPALQGSRIFAAPFGFLGGFVGTIFGTGGPFYVIYLGLRSLEKSAFRATFAINFLIDGAIRLGAYALFGFLQGGVLFGSIAALPIVALGLWAGGRIHTELSQKAYVRIISVVVFISGVALLFKM